ncbi:MAG TPA: cytochrome c [Variovorax sp.]|nr:cytochrome c [Variovorax sp.]
MLRIALACVLAPAAAAARGQALAQGTADAALVARGAYVARLGDCAGCHSAPGEPAFTGGLALHSPLGTIYSTNITPDRETGIGAYSLADFDRALRAGESPRHHLYPAMPYASFAKTSSDDVAALYAYFMQGVTPVNRMPPKTKLHFPFDQRWGLAVWNWLFLDKSANRDDGARSAQWNRGAYLVQGLGHCGSCHTPRGLAYQERGYTQASDRYLAGGITDHWLAPGIGSGPGGSVENWSVRQIAQFLKTGHGARAMAFGPMKEVVADSTQYVDEADLLSIGTYLKSLAPRRAAGTFLPASQADRTVDWLASGDVRVPGAGLYDNFCAKCHQTNGAGDPAKAPALAGSGAVRGVDPSSVVHMILSGGKPHQPPGMPAIDPMPAFGDRFDDREIAEVASFVRRSWGNDAPPVTARKVQQERAAIGAEKP